MTDPITPHDAQALRAAQRRAARRTAFILASIALVFFLGVMVKFWWFL